MAFSLESHRNYLLWWSLSSLSSGLINRGRIVPRNNWIINVFIIKYIYPHLLIRRRTRIFSVSQCVRALFGWMLHWLWIDSENYRTISSTAHNSAIATAAAAAAGVTPTKISNDTKHIPSQNSRTWLMISDRDSCHPLDLESTCSARSFDGSLPEGLTDWLMGCFVLPLLLLLWSMGSLLGIEAFHHFTIPWRG